jgi:hypothetical protein
MAIDLSLLILDVQVSLSDIPDNYATDEQLYDSIKMADAYITSLIDITITDDLHKKAIRALATYFAYVNYTSLVERTRGEVSQASSIKLAALQRIAVSFLRRITTLAINDDTTVDQSALAKKLYAGIGLSMSVLDSNISH